jgi:hypothetical protein
MASGRPRIQARYSRKGELMRQSQRARLRRPAARIRLAAALAGVLAGASLAAAGASVISATPAAASDYCGAHGVQTAGQCTFSDTYAAVGQDTFTVPPGVTYVRVTAIGAAGGPFNEQEAGVPGAPGAQVKSLVSVFPGEDLYVDVARGGGDGGGGSADIGRSEGLGGGGASIVQACPVAFGTCTGYEGDTRLVVAGGGGGDAPSGTGGTEGGAAGAGANVACDAGQDGQAGVTGSGQGGLGAACTQGGAGGGGSPPAHSGTAGTVTSGGSGGRGTYGGGGGGAGWFGGGGGGGGSNGGGGGGGGSSGVDINNSYDVSMTLTQANPSVTITYPTTGPVISTKASPGFSGGGSGTLSDTATLTGGHSPTGTVSFLLYDGACTEGGRIVPTEVYGVTVPVVSGHATAGPYTPVAAGTYYWVADYSGDPDNLSAAGVCGAAGETVVVGEASPKISTTPSGATAAGQYVHDTATLSGSFGYVEGYMFFRLYGPNTKCSGRPAAVSVRLMNGNTSVNSVPVQVTAPGTYRWRDFYSGDSDNNPVESPCGEQVNVGPGKGQPTPRNP